MGEKLYYTTQELDEMYAQRGWEVNSFMEQGFECRDSFCKTSYGWVMSFEDCCPYCVHYLIKAYGSKEDKIKFNNEMTMGEGYRIPITHKEVAEDNYKKRKRHVSKVKRGCKKRARRRSYEKLLRAMRKAGICVTRKIPETVYRGLFGFIEVKDRKMKWYYVFLPDTKACQSSFMCIKDAQELLVEAQAFYAKYLPDAPLPASIDDLTIVDV